VLKKCASRPRTFPVHSIYVVDDENRDWKGRLR
jgi:hypothetical protein